MRRWETGHCQFFIKTYGDKKGERTGGKAVTEDSQQPFFLISFALLDPACI